MRSAQRVAVVGSGISGLASAWLLAQKHQVTLYEAGDALGGHTNTVDVTLEGVSHPVDTGFLVYNTRTYPNLTAMFAHLGVASVESEMSFAVSLDEPRLEWAGSSLATVFGQKRNLLRPDFWRMLSDIVRFNRESVAWLDRHGDDSLSLRDFLAAGGYSRPFAEWYLLPMAAAIWSCPAGQMLDYPLASFVRFCRNHGLLQVFDRPLWRTVRGGGRQYVNKLAACLDDVRLATPVRA
ncbi:NAD(P)/FAD-dependent oxidoreductase, partial [Accumulibacter sp.]